MEYSAVVCKIEVRPHFNADRLQIGTVCSVDVIVGPDTKDGDMGLYFPPDGQLSMEFAEANNLVSKTNPETGKKTGGYFGKNRRVRAQKFRGVDSYGFWIPISSLDFIHKQNSTWVEGTTLNTVVGVPICNKYITPATIKALRNQSSLLKRQNKLFAKHFDTEYLRRNLDKIPIGSILYFSEKLHGSSGRTGCVLEEGTMKRTLWQAFCCGLMGVGFKRTIPSKKYTTITGTRNTILKERTSPGFYGNEEFRGVIEDKVKGLLHKGEILYYEIVGYTTAGKSIMQGAEITNKELKKTYGKTMSYTYGCKEKKCEMYVYRITHVNEDGITTDLSWPQVIERCKELGIKHVPNLDMNNTAQPIIYEGDSDSLLEIIEFLVEGASTLDARHIREGVVIRVESAQGVKAYKEKSHDFLVLEGLAKDKEDYVDMEEAA